MTLYFYRPHNYCHTVVSLLIINTIVTKIPISLNTEYISPKVLNNWDIKEKTGKVRMMNTKTHYKISLYLHQSPAKTKADHPPGFPHILLKCRITKFRETTRSACVPTIQLRLFKTCLELITSKYIGTASKFIFNNAAILMFFFLMRLDTPVIWSLTSKFRLILLALLRSERFSFTDCLEGIAEVTFQTNAWKISPQNTEVHLKIPLIKSNFVPRVFSYPSLRSERGRERQRRVGERTSEWGCI